MTGCGIGEIGIISQSKNPVRIWCQCAFEETEKLMGLRQEKK